MGRRATSVRRRATSARRHRTFLRRRKFLPSVVRLLYDVIRDLHDVVVGRVVVNGRRHSTQGSRRRGVITLRQHRRRSSESGQDEEGRARVVRMTPEQVSTTGKQTGGSAMRDATVRLPVFRSTQTVLF